MARSKKAPKEKKVRAPKTRVATVDAVEVEEVKAGGWGIDEGIVITTTIATAGAVYLMWSQLQIYTA